MRFDFDPTPGSVGGSVWAHPPFVNDPQLGRRTFGLPCPRPDFPQSFISTKMRARIYMSFSEDEDSYHTVLFGGTVNKSFPAPLNESFLELQMQSCRETIERHYPQLGFAGG